MANLAYTATGGVVVAGLTPAAGPKPTVNINYAFNSGSTPADDYISDTFIVNANTPATALNLGKIATGLILAIQVADGPILLTVTQDQGAGPVDVVLKVDNFVLIESGFLGLKVANPSLTLAVEISVTALGNRVAVGGGPGVF